MDKSNTPVIILIGLTGAGKSLVARLFEETGRAERVARLTTRKLRGDDDPLLVLSVSKIEPADNDFIYHGWNDDMYCIPYSFVFNIIQKQRLPIVELGAFDDANKLKQMLGYAYIVLIERPFDTASIRRTCSERGMSEDDILARIESLTEDYLELETNRQKFDYIIDNQYAVEYLQQRVWQLLDTIAKKPQPSIFSGE